MQTHMRHERRIPGVGQAPVGIEVAPEKFEGFPKVWHVAMVADAKAFALEVAYA